jgi:hypothetical protein
MKSLKALSVVLSLVAATALQATSINYLASVDGTTPPPGVASFVATGGGLTVATKNVDVTFLGVTGGPAGPELDLGQTLTVNFFQPERLGSITLALLFNGPEYGDKNEVAAAKTDSGDVYKLKVTGEFAGTWYKNGVAQYAVTGSETWEGGDGLWTLVNPFGTDKVVSFTLYPLTASAGFKSNSDFGLFAFSTVPDAGSTVALMGLALIGLAGAARRSRR